MADIPTHNLVFQFPDDGGGDPARGGGDGGMSSVLETLKHIQVNVGAINGNVRAILDTLRRIATSGRSVAGTSARREGSGTARDRGSRVQVERVFHVDPRKSIVPYRGAEGQRVGGEEPFSPGRIYVENLRMARRVGRTPLLTGSPWWLQNWADQRQQFRDRMARPALPPGGQAGGGLVVYDPSFAARQSQRFRAAAWRSANPSSVGSQGGAIPMGGNFSPSNAGFFSPFGLGFGNGMAVPFGGPAAMRGPANAAAQQANRNGSGGVGFMAIVSGVGRILATISMIGTAIRMIVSFVKYIPNLAVEMRTRMGNVSVPMAQMNANVRMAEILDQMKIANNRGVVSAYRSFTQAQLGFIQETRPIRQFFTQSAAEIGSLGLTLGSAASTLITGLFSGNMSNAVMGAMGVGGTLMPHFMWMRMAYETWLSGRLANMRNVVQSQFELDLETMTGGRFSTSSAYTSKAANKRNWWDYRP